MKHETKLGLLAPCLFVYFVMKQEVQVKMLLLVILLL